MTTWTAPKTWAGGELETATTKNAERDNFLYLKNLSTSTSTLSADASIASASFTDIDATWNIAITPRNTSVILVANMTVTVANFSKIAYFTAEQDDSSTQVVLGDSSTGIVWLTNPGAGGTYAPLPVTFAFLVTGLSAGTEYTFTPQMRGNDTTSHTVKADSTLWAMDTV